MALWSTWRPAKVVFLILRTLCQVPYPVEWLLLNAGALQARRCFSFLISSCLPLKINLQRIPDPPCSKSKDYLLPPITTQSIVPFFNKNNDNFCDSCSQWYCSLKLPLQQLPFANEMFINFCSPYVLIDLITTNTSVLLVIVQHARSRAIKLWNICFPSCFNFV